MAKNNIIPVFIPFAGCPFECIYCNQKEITGHTSIPDFSELEAKIEREIKYFKTSKPIEIAFYGGTFTMLPFKLQLDYFSFLQKYIKKGILQGIRVSTRPDAIVKDEILKLMDLGLQTIEFGIQSSNQKVLDLSGRNIDLESTKKNIKWIKKIGLNLGLQQMIGLPGDTYEKSLITANWIRDLQPDFVRIYPTIVLKDTELESMYFKNRYKPLSLEEAISWSSDLLDYYELNEIDVIRVGLPPLEDLDSFVDGPYHLQFREYAENSRYIKKLFSMMDEFKKDRNIILQANRTTINRIVGPNKIGKKKIEKIFGPISFLPTEERNMIVIASENKSIKIDISKSPWREVCI